MFISWIFKISQAQKFEKDACRKIPELRLINSWTSGILIQYLWKMEWEICILQLNQRNTIPGGEQLWAKRGVREGAVGGGTAWPVAGDLVGQAVASAL